MIVIIMLNYNNYNDGDDANYDNDDGTDRIVLLFVQPKCCRFTKYILLQHTSVDF